MQIHPLACVEKNAVIGDGTTVDAGAVIRDGATIGARVRIHPGVVIEGWCDIADDCELFPHAVIGKEPRNPGCVSRPCHAQGRTTIGAGSQIGVAAVIYRDVTIGSRTLIGDHVSIREDCRIGDSTIIGRHVTVNYQTRIGSHVKIMDLTHVTGSVIIEDDVFISIGVMMANDNRVGAEMQGYDPLHVVGPTLRKSAFIGVGAILMPGIVVGYGSVAGAGAIVTKDIPDGMLAIGSPARVIRKVDQAPPP